MFKVDAQKASYTNKLLHRIPKDNQKLKSSYFIQIEM